MAHSLHIFDSQTQGLVDLLDGHELCDVPVPCAVKGLRGAAEDHRQAVGAGVAGRGDHGGAGRD